MTESSGTASVSAQRSESMKQLQLVQLYRPLIDRSYEAPYNWYYLVFKPFNNTYDINKYAVCLSKCVDYLRKSKHIAVTISSREILAAKIHTNHLVCSNEDLYDLLHGKNISTRGLKYKIAVECVEGMEHRINVLHYIFKEANLRDFKIYTDHASTNSNTATYVDEVPNSVEEQDESMVVNSTDREFASYYSDDPDEPINLTRRLF